MDAFGYLSVLLSMMAAVVLPEEVTEHGLDLQLYYERQNPWLFGFFLATLAVSVIKEVLLTGRLPLGINLSFHIVLAIVCVGGLVIRSARIHQALAISTAVAIVAYIAILFARLR
jgi:hypothetical protein